MLDLRTTLKRHEFARIGDGPSSTRAIPFFYRDIVGTNPAHRIDIITGHPDHHDWYFRIYDGNRKICHDRHFHSQEDALAAAWAIHSEAEATELRLCKIERWPGDRSLKSPVFLPRFTPSKACRVNDMAVIGKLVVGVCLPSSGPAEPEPQARSLGLRCHALSKVGRVPPAESA